MNKKDSVLLIRIDERVANLHECIDSLRKELGEFRGEFKLLDHLVQNHQIYFKLMAYIISLGSVLLGIWKGLVKWLR